ncbi:YozQ family protein [Ornithinibacillus sp. BX22]|uniref:YozQ family protein n=2 Tax=Ornithinibacillus TaxID=484508 RepID=A0A923RLQ5_9BACI|nr:MULTISPECIES: YozQ family protein [Ornithinibacillus]MBC5638347.1 YozQ family protein [Ornithinibacillus hominis]MBS3678678.1 YozQ family protein [Ornithinibacillus massiliensis]
MGKDKKELNKSNDVAEKYFDVSGYQSNNQAEKGMAITHEQATDAYTEGTIDGSIDQLDEQGELKSYHGEELDKDNF